LLSDYSYSNRSIVVYLKGNLNSSYGRNPIYILVRYRIGKPSNEEFSSDSIRSTLSSSESTVV
jgi:hypothetical protein